MPANKGAQIHARISYSIVGEHISLKLSQFMEAFIRQGYSEGACCEFDWAEVKINLDGQYRRYYLAVFTSAFNNYRYAMLFQRQDSPAYDCSRCDLNTGLIERFCRN